MRLIDTLASIMRPGATWLIETNVLLETPSQAQFIESPFWGDESYWLIFGDRCLMGVLRSIGLKDVRMPLKTACDSRNPSNPKLTVEGRSSGARAWFVTTRG